MISDAKTGGVENHKQQFIRILFVANSFFLWVVKYKENWCQHIPKTIQINNFWPSRQMFEISFAYGNIPALGLGRLGCTRFSISEVGCRRLLGWKGRFSMPYWIPPKCLNQPNRNQKGSQIEPRYLERHLRGTDSKQVAKRVVKADICWFNFGTKHLNITPNTSQKHPLTSHGQTWQMMATRCQKGTRILCFPICRERVTLGHSMSYLCLK